MNVKGEKVLNYKYIMYKVRFLSINIHILLEEIYLLKNRKKIHKKYKIVYSKI